MKMFKAKKKRGQIVVYDFMFGFITFLIIITVATILWLQSSIRVEQENNQELMLKMAYDLSAILTQTSGNPARWEYMEDSFFENNNFTIGFALDNNILCENKLLKFKNLTDTIIGYDNVTKLLNLPNNNFRIRIRDAEDGVNGTFTTGKPPGINLSATVTRKIILNNQVGSIEVTIH